MVRLTHLPRYRVPFTGTADRSKLDALSGPSREGGRIGWLGFYLRLETVDGEPAEPATLSAAVPNWKPGGRIPLGKRTLRVIDKRWSSK